MNSQVMIRTEALTKEYRLYNSKKERLIEALFPSSKSNKRVYRALNNVSLEVREGETVGIIGVTGSGKSTLLKILTGVVTPTSGITEVKGRVSALLELGAGFNPEYTGLENIYLNGTMMNIPKEEMDQLVPEIVSFADIGEFIKQPVKNYSSGMFARLAFAVAISVKPDVLIVDEALSVGDIFFQTKCYKKFDEFRAAGMTILLVSHDLNSISKYCNRTILLSKGNLIADGKPKEVVDLYKRMLSNQLDTNANEPEVHDAAPESDDLDNWQNSMYRNPERLEYGDKRAEIVDYGIFDHHGIVTNTVSKGDTTEIRMKVKFHDRIENPIFAFTIKNKLGIELTGINTMIEDCDLSAGERDKTYVISFTQPVMLQGGEYLLSLGCTGFGNDQLEVYHRLYDVCNFVVVTSKNTVGFYDMGSTVSIKEVG